MSTEEVYTIRELAQVMGVPRQTVVSWRQNKQIPAKALTTEGTFIKSVIDPFIEIYKRTPPDTDTKPNQHTMTTEKKKTKGFPLKVKKEAMRLIVEEKLPMRTVAERIGCSVNSIQSWKKQYKAKKSKPSTPKSVPPVKQSTAKITYEEFVRDYWSGGTKAVDVLLLSPETGQEVVKYVNEALRFAYDQFHK